MLWKNSWLSKGPFNFVTRKGKLVTFVLFQAKNLQFIYDQNNANWEILCTDNGVKSKISCLFLVISTFTMSSGPPIPFYTLNFMIANVRCSLTVYQYKVRQLKIKRSPSTTLNLVFNRQSVINDQLAILSAIFNSQLCFTSAK